jgi:mgtE-like transporter
MIHAGSSTSFSKALKETLTAFVFNLGGLLAGFLVAFQLDVFQKVPWAIALFPAVIGAKGVIEGLLSGRLSTALHLGTIYPRFSGNTKSFYKLIEAVIVLTLATSVTMSAISLFFGQLFWGITFADFPAILGVVVATMTLGLALLAVTVKVAFVSFKRGLDPDIMVYPVMSTVATIFITLCYVVVLNLFFFFNNVGIWTIALLGIVNLLLVLYIFPRNLHEPEFIKTIKESLVALMIVALIVNVTGTLLKGIDRSVRNSIEIYTLYPALIGLISGVGSVVGSTATTKLALGLLKPKLSSIWHHAKSILSAWIASLVMFVILAFAALLIHGIFSPAAFYSHLVVLLVANVIAVILIVLLSFTVSILTFQKGLDPGNFVIPIETSFAASVTSVALLTALVLLGLG